MKKILLFPLAVAMLFAANGCSSEDPKAPETPSVPVVEPVAGPLDKIIAVADSAFAQFYPNAAAKSRARGADVICIATPGSRVARPDTLLYIVNYDDEAGFVLMANNRQSEIVLAVSDSGNIQSMGTGENPALDIYLDAALNFAESLSDGPENPRPMYVFQEQIISPSVTVDPMIDARWGRFYPEGMYCPNGNCGCYTTAAAQILSAFCEPENLTLTYDNNQAMEMHWGMMVGKSRSYSWERYYSYGVSETGSHFNVAYEQGLGKVCRELSHRMNSTYNFGSVTTSTLEDCRTAMAGVSSRVSVSSISTGMPVSKNYLTAPGIVVMEGAQTSTDAKQAWVIDGCVYVNKIIHWYRYNSATDSYVYERSDPMFTDYQHINWGFSGKRNGYFSSQVYDTTQGLNYDSGSTTSDEAHDYQYGFRYFVATLLH